MSSSINNENTIIAHGTFMAYVGDDASYDAVRVFAEKTGLPSAVVQPGGIDVLTGLISQAQTLPKIILVDIDNISNPSADPLPAITRIIEALDGVSKIIAIGSVNDVRLFRGLLAAGAADYVVKPLTTEILETAYQNAQNAIREDNNEAEDVTGHIIPVIGVRGGVGATTIAVNLGWMLAHNFKHQTALLDLDLHFGTSTLALDLVPRRGLREALETPGRLDSLLIASSMVTESERFSILGAEESLEDVLHYDPAAVMAIAQELKPNFNYILVDLPRAQLAEQKRLLADSGTIIIVAEQTLAAIRDVVRLKAALKTIAPQARLIHIVSRVGNGRGDRAGQVDQAMFEKGISDKISILVPEDSAIVANAANRGQPLGKLAPNAAITQAIASLAQMVTGQTPTTSKQAIWSRMASKFKKNANKTNDNDKA